MDMRYYARGQDFYCETQKFTETEYYEGMFTEQKINIRSKYEVRG